MINSYIVRGYNLMNRPSTGATMVKRKQLSVLWLVIGFLLCVIPLLIYLLVYAGEQDQVVEIRLAPLPAHVDTLALAAATP